MSRDPLKQVRIAAPCPASWMSMKGDDQVRFCGSCKLNVYNISEMRRDEALALIQSHEGRLCIRMYQRQDGTVLTKNCPVGLAAMRKRLAYATAVLAALAFGSFSAAMASIRSSDERRESLVEQARTWPVVCKLIDTLSPRATSGMLATPMMGAIAAPV